MPLTVNLEPFILKNQRQVFQSSETKSSRVKHSTGKEFQNQAVRGKKLLAEISL